jgi:circadian clock protein KaiB
MRGTATDVWELRLYIAGQTGRSIAALSNLKKICDAHLPGRYKLKVIDLLIQPELASGDQIIAVPTVVRAVPRPTRKIVGDLSDLQQTLIGLELITTNDGKVTPPPIGETEEGS